MTEESIPDIISGLLLGSLFYFLLFLVTSYFAKMKGFLTLPFKRFMGVYTSGIDVLFLLLFFVISFISTGVVIAMIAERNSSPSALTTVLVPLSPFVINIALIGIYSLLNRSFFLKGIIKDNLFPGRKSFSHDIRDGLITLLLSFPPLFTFVTLIEALFIWISSQKPAGQDAVNFLIQAKDSPLTLTVALVSIIIGAPIVEEFLFRGVIQSFFRKKAGSIGSIVITSIFFSAFHFSMAQGFQNIVIILSLFILSLYLGFVYEKTRSLLSSITLHVTFNLINAIKIIFYSG